MWEVTATVRFETESGARDFAKYLQSLDGKYIGNVTVKDSSK